MLFCVLSPQPSAGPGNQVAAPSEVSTPRLRTNVWVHRLLAFHAPLITSCSRVPMTLQEDVYRKGKTEVKGQKQDNEKFRREKGGKVSGHQEKETKGICQEGRKWKQRVIKYWGSYGSWECVHGRIWISRCIMGDLLRCSYLNQYQQEAPQWKPASVEHLRQQGLTYTN